MIFMYPAVVSETVDDKIASAVTKVLEQYFLLNIQEGFQNGHLRVKTVFNVSKQIYGPLDLITEGVKINKNVLLESRAQDIKDAGKDVGSKATYAEGLWTDLETQWDNCIVSKDHNLSVIWKASLSELESLEEQYKKGIEDAEQILREVYEGIAYLDSQYSNIQDYIDKNYFDNTQWDVERFNKARSNISNMRKGVRDKLREANKYFETIQRQLRKLDVDEKKEKREEEKERREAEKREEEQKEKELKQYETHGSFRVDIIKGVSLRPTMANITVPIHYIGGPHSRTKSLTRITADASKQELAIGTKVIPVRIENFRHIENAILSDYFSNQIQVFWKNLSRKFLRWSIQKISHIARSLFKADLDLESKFGPKWNILLSPQGYINSSSFDSKARTGKSYKYSATTIIMTKDDILKEEGQNFFLNRTQLTKMFKMGWNSFCILDPIKEQATFITSIDGGHMHVIPYSYIYNLLGMDQLYKDENDLKRRSPVFRRSDGNFSKFLSKLKREERLLKTARSRRRR